MRHQPRGRLTDIEALVGCRALDGNQSPRRDRFARQLIKVPVAPRVRAMAAAANPVPLALTKVRLFITLCS